LLIDQYETGSALVTKSHQTAKENSTVMRRLMASAGARTVLDIDSAAVAKYLGDMHAGGASPKTILNHKGGIGSFFRWLKIIGRLPRQDGHGWPWVNPVLGMPTPDVEEAMPYHLSASEIAEVQVLARRFGMWPEVAIALATGMRREEIGRMKWIDVDWVNKTIAVIKSKGKRPRMIPCNEQARAALTAQKQMTGHLIYVFPARKTSPGCRRRAPEFFDRPRLASWFDRAIKPIHQAVPKFQQARSGPGRGWHLFRHTFASRAAQAGIPIYTIARWLGHAQVSTTQRYAHLAPIYESQIELIMPMPEPPPADVPEVLPLFPTLT
jgi:integrase